MGEAQRKLIASLGGKTAHATGRAHQWTTETARLAGREGGIRSQANRKAKKAAATASADAATT